MRYIILLLLLVTHQIRANSYVDGENQFGFELYGKLFDKKENCCFSPYSIGNALALAYAGAAGETKSEMSALLSYPAVDLYKEIHALKTFLAPAVSSAEAVVIDQDFHPLKGYLDTVHNKLDAEIFEMNTTKSSKEAILHINQWVSAKTKGFIPSLLQPNDIQNATKMVLLNAVYLKALWVSPFSEHLTKDDVFYTPSSEKLHVPMMHKSEQMKLYQDDAYYVVWQDMRRESESAPQLETIIVLPRSENARACLFSTDQLALWEKQSGRQYVELFMPKCSLRKRTELKKPLQALGMNQAFTNEANFSEICPLNASEHSFDGPLIIGEVIHEAFMQIDEAGVEAAAATAITMMTMSVPVKQKEPIVVRCDTPFFVLIREKTSGLVLFISYIATPEKIFEKTVVRS